MQDRTIHVGNNF